MPLVEHKEDCVMNKARMLLVKADKQRSCSKTSKGSRREKHEAQDAAVEPANNGWNVILVVVGLRK
jgi:hypothetical protein